MERREPGAGVPELAEYADGFVAWLGGLGYSPRTCEAQVALLRHLARWLAQQGVPLSGLSSEVAGEYAAVRRGQAPLARQPSPEPRQQHVRGLVRHDGRGRRDGTEFPQVAQHRPERPVRPQMRQLSPADGSVLAGHLAAQSGQRHSLLREPAG